MKSLLITGVSSGIGRGLTEKFVSKGYRVVGSVRNREAGAELQARHGDFFIPLNFDVTRPEEIAVAAKQLKNDLGVEHLSAIINNAGSARLSPLLYVPIDEFRKELDILVVGQLAVTQEFFSFLIPDDPARDAGRIINISSISGVGINYLFGPYAAGKHALEGMSKTLRRECQPFGVKVVVVAPGNIATAIWDDQTDDNVEKYRDTEYYDALRHKVRHIHSDVVKTAMTIEEFADAFYRIYEDGSSADRYTVIKSRNKKVPFSKAKVRVLRS